MIFCKILVYKVDSIYAGVYRLNKYIYTYMLYV